MHISLQYVHICFGPDIVTGYAHIGEKLRIHAANYMRIYMRIRVTPETVRTCTEIILFQCYSYKKLYGSYNFCLEFWICAYCPQAHAYMRIIMIDLHMRLRISSFLYSFSIFYVCLCVCIYAYMHIQSTLDKPDWLVWPKLSSEKRVGLRKDDFPFKTSNSFWQKSS